MASRKKVMIVSGVFLMAAGIFSAASLVFYQFQVKPEMAKRDVSVPGKVSPAAQNKPAGPQGVGIDALMNYSKGLYGSDEAGRREGTLWVDQAEQKLVVNLGALNGLKSQDHLMVYDHDQKIGQVQVSRVFDVVAYVEQDKSFDGSMTKDYYKVVKE